MSGAFISLTEVQKNYGGLRPLRIRFLEVADGERIAISGLDGPAAETLVNLITGAVLPDGGVVSTFGQSTADIADGDAWLASLERFAIISPRAILLEGSTLQQNLALPFTLDIDPVPAAIAERVAALARECGISDEDLARPAAEMPAGVRVRVHLARALALKPELLLIEHPTADVPESERAPLARDLARAVDGRRLSALIVTTDADFADAAAHRLLVLQPATGTLVAWKRKRGWFR